MIPSQEGLVTPNFCSLGYQWELTTHINSVLSQGAASFPPNWACTLFQPTSRILDFKKSENDIYPRAFLWRIQAESSLKKKKKRVGGRQKETVRKLQGGQEILQQQGIGQAQAQEIPLTALALGRVHTLCERRAQRIICSTPTSPTCKGKGPLQAPVKLPLTGWHSPYCAWFHGAQSTDTS